jgi:hypothetical protein
MARPQAGGRRAPGRGTRVSAPPALARAQTESARRDYQSRPGAYPITTDSMNSNKATNPPGLPGRAPITRQGEQPQRINPGPRAGRSARNVPQDPVRR